MSFSLKKLFDFQPKETLMKRRFLIPTLALLAGCGNKGDLVRPTAASETPASH